MAREILRIFGAVLLIATAGVASADTLIVRASKTIVKSGQDVEIPIEITGAKGLTSLQFAFLYDAKIIEIRDVQKGALLPENSLLVHNLEQPGRCGIAMISGTNEDQSGLASIDKAGIIIKIQAKLLGKPGQISSLQIVNLKAGSKKDQWLLAQAEDSELQIADESAFPWIYVVGGALALVVILIAGKLVVGRKKD